MDKNNRLRLIIELKDENQELWILKNERLDNHGCWINIKIMDIEQTVDLIRKKNIDVE